MNGPADDVVIDVRSLTRRFGSLVAADNVSFQVHRGAIFGLLGPNGSGKSTIIRMLCGVLSPSEGEANVLGYDITHEAELLKRQIGYMSQQFSLYGDLSVRENIEFYGRVYGLSAARLAERSRAVVELTSLGDRLGQLARTLSGGWKQRLGLACALIHEPEVIFLDEPTAGIDPVARRELWDLLFELSSRGVTLIVTTHYMDEAERCTDVGYLYASRLIVCGKPDELRELPAVNPAGTRRLELEVPSPSTDVPRLKQIDGVLESIPYGRTVHLLVREGIDEASLLEQSGIDKEEANLRSAQPSLEDVFFTLSREAEKDSVKRKAEGGQREEAGGRKPEVGSREAFAVDQGRLHRSSNFRPRSSTPRGGPMFGFMAMLRKELAHLSREPSTLFFMFVVPLVQLTIFGYAIDTEIEHIPTVVYNTDGRRESRELIEAFTNTRVFAVVANAYNEESFQRALTSGEAKVGIKIPPDYTDRLLLAEQAQVQVLIDGSDSQTATAALNAASLLGTTRSIAKARSLADALERVPARNAFGDPSLPIEIRPRLLYNPNLESSHFFVPGLLAIILQLVTLFLTSFAIVREREQGTLEQLFVTPVGRAALVLGKLVPYALIGFVETLIVMSVMVYVFGVPIHGSVILLVSLSMLFLVCGLGLGLLVSTLARTQLQAMQFAFLIMLPSVLLSGFMFPRAQMPLPIYLLTFLIPVTYFVEILRGVVLRAADLRDIFPQVFALALCCVVILSLAIMRFRKQLG